MEFKLRRIAKDSYIWEIRLSGVLEPRQMPKDHQEVFDSLAAAAEEFYKRTFGENPPEDPAWSHPFHDYADEMKAMGGLLPTRFRSVSE